jgi:hypothetical protein
MTKFATEKYEKEILRQMVRDAVGIISTTRFHRWEPNFQKACDFLGFAKAEGLYEDESADGH